MPLFEFICKDCGNHGELLVLGNEKPVCESCGSKRMEKQLSQFAPVMGGKPEPAPCGAGGCPHFQDGVCGK